MVLLLLVADAVVDAAVLPVGDCPIKPDAVLAVEEDAPVPVSDAVEEVSEEVVSLVELVLLALLLRSAVESVDSDATELDTTEFVDVAATDEDMEAASILLAVVSDESAVPCCRRYSCGWLSAADNACWCISR